MSTDAQMAERHGRILAELSELGLSLARSLHDKAEAAATPAEARAVAEAYHRVARAVRLTVGLEAKLARDRVRLDRETAQAARKDQEQGAAARKARLRASVKRHLRAACGEEESDAMEEDLDLLIEAEETAEGFLAEPIEAQIVRICEALDVDLPEEFAPPPDPPAGPPWSADESSAPPGSPPPSEGPWRSSG